MKRVITVVVVIGILMCVGVSCKGRPAVTSPSPRPSHAPDEMAGFPETLDLPAELAPPHEASLQAIVARYYKSLKLYNGTTILIAPEHVPAIAARIAKYNNITDTSAKVPAGRVLKLPRVYVIAAGDTLYSIARAVYGDPKRWKDIQALNKDYEPQKLEIGWVLILP
jgi:5'-nucleotidase